jgi:radical SAM superfamily enzyme YgiQ (UPF0313 family)
MSTHKVVFVEFPVFHGVLPLASGYMEAYCRKDADLAALCTFEKISLPVKTPYADVLAALRRADGDIYAFSCYVWNVGRVRRLLKVLRAEKPNAHFILGGPQVMHQAAQYIEPDVENVYICNGEGERTSAAFLRSVLCHDQDLATVRGLSFNRNGTLITTEPEPRITDLSEIPSPFLEGLFEQQRYTWTLIETNRGCPFKCNYCFWGAATGARVFKYDEQRLERELEWISQSKCIYLFIADANFGMLKRDVDLTKFIVECQKKNGSPTSVYFCGSKNTPERAAEISRVFHEAGMIATQSVALQTMNTETLKRVNRENIKLSAYAHLQQSLNDRGISSVIEIIWPLPGETLESFQVGLAQLCQNSADAFVVYPLLLMNNVELAQKRQEYGLVTVRDPDPDSEAEIVIETNEVNRSTYEEGIRYYYAITSLYTLRGLWYLSRYLALSGKVRYEELFRGFVEYAKQHPDNPYTRFTEASIAHLATGNFVNIGELVHLTLHAERDAFDTLLSGFVRSQEFWQDPAAQCMFAIDVINRPYIYFNTPLTEKQLESGQLNAVVVDEVGYLVQVFPEFAELVRKYVVTDYQDAPDTIFEVNHRRVQLPFMSRKSEYENFVYCQDMAQRMRDIVPVWTQVADLAPV